MDWDKAYSFYYQKEATRIAQKKRGKKKQGQQGHFTWAIHKLQPMCRASSVQI
jgi:hypothetical protein